MAAFDRICSGIPEMDNALDNIRLGDNVVWRVSELSEFKLFMEPYLRQAIADGRNIIYTSGLQVMSLLLRTVPMSRP